MHIPPDPDVEKFTDNGVSVHDKVSERLSPSLLPPSDTINFINGGSGGEKN